MQTFQVSSWKPDYVAVTHVATGRLFGFAIQEADGQTLKLIGGVDVGSDDGTSGALHQEAIEFAREQAEQRLGKKVRV